MIEKKQGLPPLYEQIYRQLKAEIVAGERRAGEKLPSKRRMAERLAVSLITVENAYAQLLAEGYITSKEKKGYYVCTIEPVPHLLCQRPVYRAPQPVQYEIDMRTDRSDNRRFPTAQWCRLSRKVMTEQSEGIFRAGSACGLRELRREIAAYLKRNRSLDVSPDCIIVGAGTEYLCDLLVKLLGSYRVYGVENPGYRKVSALYQSSGARCFYLPLDEGGLAMQPLRASPVEVLHLSPNHQYPTGLVTTAARRFELLSWAAEREGRYVIEDDYDSEFRFDTRPCGTMLAEDSNERVIYMNTFSKTIAPSLRIGYLVLPPHLMDLYLKKFDCFSCTVSNLEQLTLAKFIGSGQYERHISRMRKYYRQRREQFFSLIRAAAPPQKLRITENDAGLHFLLSFSSPYSDKQIKEQALSQGIALSFLSDFSYYPDTTFAHALVVNYGGIDAADFQKVLSFLQTVWQ